MIIHCAFDELVKIKDLKPHPKNRNKHPKEQIERLSKILEYQGWRYPVKVSRLSGFVTSGHGRIEAARDNGWDEVPVNYQDYEDEAQEYADVTADNAIASWAELDLSGINFDVPDFGPDFDIDMLGIDGFVIEPAEKFEPQADADELPSTIDARVRSGDLWSLGRHRLKCGDSTSHDDVSQLLGGQTAELCFTSPPYADQREYNGGKDLNTEHLATFIRTSFSQVRYFAVNLGYARKNGEVFRYWDDYIKEAKDCGLKFLSWNIWDKGECGSIGNQTAMFAIQHEWIFVFGPNTKDLNRTVPNKSAGEKTHGSTRMKDGSLKPADTRGSVGEFSQLKTIITQTPLKARNHGLDHPAMFPVEFPTAYIEACTNPGQIVYEPFGGSGTTLIACEGNDRDCRIMELDPKYADMILARWEKYTGQKAELINAHV